MRLIAIDPGTQVVGYALLERQGGAIVPLDFGAIDARREPTYAARLCKIFASIEQLIAKYKPTVMAIETAFFHKNVRSALKLGEGRGVCLLAAARAGLEIREFSPRQAKKAVTGRGGAKKYQIQVLVTQILGLKEIPEPADAADAIALGICLLNDAEMDAVTGGVSPSMPKTTRRRGPVRYEDIAHLLEP